MLRDMAFMYFFGAGGLADSWFIAFKIPNLSRRLFGEGAASASFIPVYSEELERDRGSAASLANTVVTAVFVLLAGLVVVGEAGIWTYYKFFAENSETRLVLSLTSIMLPYMVLVCTVAIVAGILHVHRHFAMPAAAPIVMNIFIIVTIVFTGWVLQIAPRQQVFAVAVAVVLAGVVQLAIQVPALRKCDVRILPAWEIRSDAFKKILLLMGPMILGLTVTQINTLFDDLIAWWFSGSPEKGEMFLFFGRSVAYPLRRGSVSYLNIAQRLYQLPLGVFGISLATAIFPVMSSEAARKDFQSLKRTISRGIRGAIFISLPATLGLILVSRPLIAALFERGKFHGDDTGKVAWTLLFYALGLSGFFIQQIVIRAFYSMQDSKVPARSAVIAVFANIVLNLTLIWYLGTGGLAASTAICSYLQVVILVLVLRKRLGAGILDGVVVSLIKTVLATLVMWISAVLCLKLSQNWWDIFKLLLVVPAAGATYFWAAKILRIEMLSLFSGRAEKG